MNRGRSLRLSMPASARAIRAALSLCSSGILIVTYEPIRTWLRAALPGSWSLHPASASTNG